MHRLGILMWKKILWYELRMKNLLIQGDAPKVFVRSVWRTEKGLSEFYYNKQLAIIIIL